MDVTQQVILIGGGAAHVSNALTTPTLAWNGDTADATPNLTVDFDNTVAAGDTLHFQYDTTITFPAPTDVNHTISSGEDTANEVPLSLSALTTGTYYVRVRTEKSGVGNSGWSNIVTMALVIASVPVISVAPVASGVANIGQTLSTTNGTWTNTPTSYTYQWQRGGVNIGSATSSTYATVDADKGTNVTCNVTASNASGAGSPSASNAIAVFSPASLSPDLWLQADDLTTLFQTVTGTTAVASDSDVVGTWKDKSGNGKDFAALANDTTRPLYHTSAGLSWVEGDGINDLLRRASALGMYSAGACSRFMAIKAGLQGSGKEVIAERNSASGNAIYALLTSTLSASHIAQYLRNDGNTTILASSPALTGVVDGTDRVLGITDSGSHMAVYANGTAGATADYTRSGVLTLDRTGIFGDEGAGTPGSWLAARIYALVVVNRVLSSGEIASLVTYLGVKAGLSI